MRYLIGKKENFAIEFNIQSERYNRHLFGGIRLWLNGKYLGAYQDINILSVTWYQLELLTKDTNIENNDFAKKSDKEVFDFIKSGDNLEGGRYFLCLGEGFDDFSVVVYRFNDMIKFIWKLYDDRPFSSFQYEDYPHSIQSAEIEINEFHKIVTEFKTKLDELSLIIPIKDIKTAL